MSAPRLLVVTTVPGTLYHFLLPYAEHMRARGWQVDALTGTVEDELRPGVAEAFDRVFDTPWQRSVKGARNWTQAPRDVRRLLLREHYDVVHVHTPIASFVLRLVVASLPKARRPAVCYTAHGFHFHPHGDKLGNRAFLAAERLAGHWTDRLLVMNDHDLEAAAARRIVTEERLVFTPGIGIDLDHYRPTPELLAAAARLRAELEIGPDQLLFSVVAALQASKGHVDVVRALAIAHDLDAVLVCAGRGPHQEAVLDEAARLGVAHRVVLTGSLADPRPLMLASRATVLASWREGLSRSVLESLALGVPVLGSRIRGVQDTAGWPGAGVLFDPGDAAGIAEAMRAVQAFPGPAELRAELEPRLKEYGIESLLAQHAEMYDELAAHRGSLASR